MITEQEFHRIVVYVKQKYGIDLTGKQILVNGRMENYLLRNGYSGYDEYMTKVEKNPKGEEARNLINVLTTNHTYFMREFEHMDFMRKVVLPQIKAKEAGKRDVRIWSAASSTGEEPYTIAMVLKDFFGLDHKMWDTRVLATDLSTKVLEQAQRGKYLKEQIDPLPEGWKRRFFKRVNELEYQVTPELKQELIFRQFNLMNPFPFRKKFHVVFMRNVMIYFDDNTKLQLLRKVYDYLEPGGYLFVGTTESIDRKGTNFQYVEPSIYRK
ncbi:protein-glutamate O-methyltransferase CheR [Lachnospiraceae bacterium KK002]